MTAPVSRTRAISMLLVTTAAWGLSFPGGKALMAAMQAGLPGRDSWFFAALTIGARFGLGALLLLLAHPKSLMDLTPREWRQGIGLGVFGGLGMLIQADGLIYAPASTSAFLTQFTAVLVPAVVAVRDRRLPSVRIVICVLLVMVGVGILGRFDFAQLRMGRGEVETLVSTAFFTGLLLWLDRPIFRGNRTGRVTMLMFGTIAVVLTPVALFHASAVSDLKVLVLNGPVSLLYVGLTLFCSMVAFLTMNRWQPHVDATTAGIVYCAEPLFATVFALFMPTWLGQFVGVDYQNEAFTSHLVIGGGLITAANVAIAAKPAA